MKAMVLSKPKTPLVWTEMPNRHPGPGQIRVKVLACGVCPYCEEKRENLCDAPLFTGYTRDGGFATAAIADARFAFPLGETRTDVALAPLLCAGLIGWRSLAAAGDGRRIGLYGFGAAGHIVAQVAR
jgi:propanol-preferring alcohol dehydrogenase